MPLRTAVAELRLDTWKTYGAMAEQGSVCAAFARLMELQSTIDAKHGALWFERRKFAGSLIRQASTLEGVSIAGQDDINALVDSYASWLISNLGNQGTTQSLDNEAHSAASEMIKDVCSDLYARADKSIMQAHPELATCPIVETPDPLVCTSGSVTEPINVKATDMTHDAHEIKRARDEVAMLTAQNKSLRAKLRALRASTLEFEMAARTSNDKMPMNIEHDKASPDYTNPDYTNIAASELITDTKLGRNINIETDLDARTALAGRNKYTTPNFDNVIPDKSQQQDETATIDQITKSPVRAKVTRNRNISNLFVAQLGSYASSQQANDGIHYLKTTFKDTFKMLELTVVSKTSRTGQQVYDLVTEKSDRADIENICNSLWEQRFGCFVTSAN
ncbi:hypothetical protein [Candidatus Puniceispirillum sp.]|uniref:hypothetical protein n=1 Tax=Candidatus Puniceispirillum sp. TaxID=2026719 RepID=UPI003F69C97D